MVYQVEGTFYITSLNTHPHIENQCSEGNHPFLRFFLLLLSPGHNRVLFFDAEAATETDPEVLRAVAAVSILLASLTLFKYC